MQEDILGVFEIVKETDMDKRPPLLKIKHNRQAKSALATANKALTNILNKFQKQLSLTEVNEIFYTTACAVCSTLGIKPRIRVYKKLKQQKWKTRIQREIGKLRREISRISEVFKEHQLKEKKKKNDNEKI